jgi:hypothetical protein
VEGEGGLAAVGGQGKMQKNQTGGLGSAVLDFELKVSERIISPKPNSKGKTGADSGDVNGGEKAKRGITGTG